MLDASIEEGGRQGRRTFACDSCYRRKIKCDAVEPQCNWCANQGITCIVTRTRRRDKKGSNGISGSGRQQKIQSSLGEHIDRIDQRCSVDSRSCSPSTGQDSSRLSQDFGSTLSDGPDNQHSPPLAHLGKLHLARIYLGNINAFNGLPFFSPEGQQWVECHSDQKVDFEKLLSYESLWQSPQSQWSTSIPSVAPTQRIVELPDRGILDQHVANYSSTVHSLFPLLDSGLFRDTTRLAYDSSSSSSSPGARACIFAFLALMSAFQPSKTASLVIEGRRYASQAQRLLSAVLQEPVTLHGLQALLMLSLYCQATFSDLQLIDMFLSIAARFVFILGGNTPHSCLSVSSCCLPASTSGVKCHLRTLFWICYAMDKKISLRTGRPPSLNDDQCDLTIPDQYLAKDIGQSSSRQISDDEPFEFLSPCNLRLSIISSKIYNSLYSVPARKKSDMELLKAICELDSDLEEWRVSVPKQHRPFFSNLHQTHPRVADTGAAIMQLQYYHSMAAVHQASSQYSAWTQDQTRVMEGVSSSLALTVQASRASLEYLREIGYIFTEESFPFMFFYPISASLTLFCNILLNPLDPRNTDDLQLLDEAPVRTSEQLSSQFSDNGMFHVKLVEGFIVELGRLATCAMDKARKGAS
ncbi:hypothetical protein DL98DRAFT_492709 [Cadophora sp. DSE1049]|nr:hypothetical protein DL98DRAFT_492709 [Cadophora sp. DSE1049]